MEQGSGANGSDAWRRTRRACPSTSRRGSTGRSFGSAAPGWSMHETTLGRFGSFTQTSAGRSDPGSLFTGPKVVYTPPPMRFSSAVTGIPGRNENEHQKSACDPNRRRIYRVRRQAGYPLHLSHLGVDESKASCFLPRPQHRRTGCFAWRRNARSPASLRPALLQHLT